MSGQNSIAADVKLGQNVKLSTFINLYGCEIGDGTKIGAFVEVQKNARIGRNCKISSHTFVCEGVRIEDNVFVGHNVTFINDSYPRATNSDGSLQTEKDWTAEPTLVKKGASIGSGSTILSKVTIGENSIVGAGSVVTRDVPANVIVAGTPARVLRSIEEKWRNSCMQADGVPFLDLVSPHAELKEQLLAVFERAIQTAAFIGGPMVADFESAFAKFCGARHCVGVGSGTDALRFALIAAGVNQGDVVVTVPNTFIATAEAISQAGAIPDFIDVDDQTYNMDPEQLRRYLQTQCVVDGTTGRVFNKRLGRPVTAVVPVHLFGQPADMDAIQSLADRFGLKVIEDACQAHGAQYFSQKESAWRTVGSIGRVAAFSFYPGKNLGACGEAGAITTDDGEIAQKVRMLRDHGQSQKYYHEFEGHNGRLDAIQAGILRAKLNHLATGNEKRRECARRYAELLSAVGPAVTLPSEQPSAKAVYHLYVIRTKSRDRLQKYLADAGVGTGIHYPVPLHLQNAYRTLGYAKGDFPVAEKAAEEILSLPMFPELEAGQQTQVANLIMKFIETEASATVLAAAATPVATLAALGE